MERSRAIVQNDQSSQFKWDKRSTRARVARSITAREHRRSFASNPRPPWSKKIAPMGSDLAFSYNPIANDDTNGRRTCRAGVPESDPRHVIGGRAMDAASFVWGGVKATSRRPFCCRAPRAGAACGGARAKKIMERRAGPQGRRDISGRKKWAGDRSRPPSPHAAKGVSSAPDTLSCWSGSGSAGAERSNATRAAAFTLPTPPRTV